MQNAVSEMPERFYVAEIIQEKMFKQYREEIPYSTTVRCSECGASTLLQHAAPCRCLACT